MDSVESNPRAYGLRQGCDLGIASICERCEQRYATQAIVFDHTVFVAHDAVKGDVANFCLDKHGTPPKLFCAALDLKTKRNQCRAAGVLRHLPLGYAAPVDKRGKLLRRHNAIQHCKPALTGRCEVDTGMTDQAELQRVHETLSQDFNADG